jgi:hypothetical protein
MVTNDTKVQTLNGDELDVHPWDDVQVYDFEEGDKS